MKIKTSCILIILLTQHSATWAEGNDALYNDGNEAHKNHCYKCHTDELYTRDNRLVKSISALGSQVRRCKDGNDVPWFDEDTDAVIHFLNEKYYKF